jgi:hypothetical protein
VSLGSDDEKRDLEVDPMCADLAAKQKRGFWETPRNLYIILGMFLTFVGILAFWVGFDIARAPPGSIVVQLPPGTVITVPAAPQAVPAK